MLFIRTLYKGFMFLHSKLVEFNGTGCGKTYDELEEPLRSLIILSIKVLLDEHRRQLSRFGSAEMTCQDACSKYKPLTKSNDSVLQVKQPKGFPGLTKKDFNLLFCCRAYCIGKVLHSLFLQHNQQEIWNSIIFSQIYQVC